MDHEPQHDNKAASSSRDEYFRALAEASIDSIYVINRQLEFEYANAVAAKAMGRTQEEVVGSTWQELLPEEYFGDHLAKVMHVLDTGVPRVSELELFLPAIGRKVWLSTTLTPIQGDDNRVRAVMGVARDITEQKQVEARLADGEKRYRTLAEAAQDFIFIIDVNGMVTYVNDHGAKMFGIAKDEIIGKKMVDLFPPEVAERQSGSVKSVIEADMPLYAESYVVMPMGDMWLGTTLSPIKGDDGKVTAVIGISRNITAKKQTEAALIAERDFSDKAINSMPGIFYLFDKNGRFVRWNQYFEEVSGYFPEEIRAMSPIDFFDGEERELIASRIAQVFADGQAEAEAELVSKQGQRTRFYFTGYRMMVDDEPYLVGVGTDISSLRRVENELRDREAVLKLERDRAEKYLEIIPSLIFVLDAQGKVSLINRKGCEVLGCDEGEIIGQDWFDKFLPEDIRNDVKGVFSRLMTGDIEPVEYYENAVVTKSGRQRIIAWHNSVLYDDDGAINGIMSSGEDITERRRAENMLSESEQRFKTIFDTAIDGILLADLDKKKFVLSNDTICNMLGYTHEELATIGVDDIHPQAALAGVVEQFERQARGELKVARDLPVMRKDGSIFYADISSAPVSLSGVNYLMGYFSDVTERHLTEEALVESEEKYRSIFEESNEVIFISTPEGRFVDINPAGVKLFGYPSREAMLAIDIGKDLFVDPSARRQYLERIERSGEVRDYEVKLRRLNGEQVIVSVSASVMRDNDGGITGFRGNMRDITMQRQLESQLVQAQKMESIGNLAGGVAHDFNNYLTAIQGYADLALLEQSEDTTLYDYLSEIRSSSGRAADLTRQLLLFGRREEVNLQPVDLTEVILNLQKMLGRLIGERFTIVTRIPAKLNTISADKGLIEQVIVNLVVNSRDAMPEGGEIFIEAANDDPRMPSNGGDGVQEHGRFVKLKVSDTGMGMDAETMSHIFEPFFTTKDVGKGTGLGLSVVYGIIAQHGGIVDVESEPGHGTAFNIYLPTAAAAVDRENQPGAEQVGVDGWGAKVLLVEDDDAVRRLAARMLSDSGFTVTEAASASEGEELFDKAQGDFDIVFSDVILPDRSGMELAMGLHERKPELGIVLASGYTGDQLNRTQIEEQGYAFIQKPYTLAELLRILSGIRTGS